MPAIIAITCPDCGARLKLAEEALGNPLKCPKCAKTFRVRARVPGESASNLPKLTRPPMPTSTSPGSSLNDQISGSVPKLTQSAAQPGPEIARPAEVLPDPSRTDDSTVAAPAVKRTPAPIPGSNSSAAHMLRPQIELSGEIPVTADAGDGVAGGEAPDITKDDPREIVAPSSGNPGDSVVPLAEVAGDPLIGRVLGGYRLLRLLGRGGRGIVYEAEDVMLGRPAAVKLLAPEVTAGDAASADRFLLEARASAKLDHPNIVGVYAVGRDGDLVFTAMALVKGVSLADELDRHGRFPVAEATRIIRLAAKGLAAAHAQGIIHRDVKPANILLSADGSVKVADFGLAKIVDEALTRLTAIGKAVGTPQYMSPEQCRGEEVDARADIYSLGATYFHLLTGQAPFSGNSAAVVARKQVSEPHPDPRKLNPAIPPAICRILDKALAKNPAARYLTVTEFATALKNAEAGIIPEEELAAVVPEVKAGTVVLDENAVLDMLKGGEDDDEDNPTSRVEASRLVPPAEGEMSGRVKAISGLGTPGGPMIVPPTNPSSRGLQAVGSETAGGTSSTRVAALPTGAATAAFRFLFDGTNHAKVALGLLPNEVRSAARKVITPIPPANGGGVTLDIAVKFVPDVLLGVVRALLSGGGRFVGLNTEDKRLGDWLRARVAEMTGAV